MQESSFLWRSLRAALGLAAIVAAGPALADGGGGGIGVDPTARIELRLVESGIDVDQGEELDSSGIAARAEAGLDFDLGETTGARVEVEGGIFEYSDAARSDRTSYGAAIEVSQELTPALELRLRLRRVENIALLESGSADQTSAAMRLQWQEGDERVRVYAEYRWREYDLGTEPRGEGWRFAGQYNHRFGSYHWLRFDLGWEEIDSDTSAARAFDRTTAKVEYSRPIARRLRVKPSLEYRRWSYEARIAQGDPQGDLRRDSYLGPGLEFAYGSDSRGTYAEAGAQYRLRRSNDTRFEDDAFRFGVTLGFRF